MTPDELDAIEARANAAVEGPWVAHPSADNRSNHLPGVRSVTGVYVALVDDDDHDGSPGNEGPLATFIAAARADVPALVAEVRRLQEEAIALRQRYNAVAMELAAMADDKVTVSLSPTANLSGFGGEVAYRDARPVPLPPAVLVYRCERCKAYHTHMPCQAEDAGAG